MTNETSIDVLTDAIHREGWSYWHTAYVDLGTGRLVHVADAHKDGIKAVAYGSTAEQAYRHLVKQLGNQELPGR